MNRPCSLSNEVWTTCSPGTLRSLQTQIRKVRRRHTAFRLAKPIMLLVVLTMAYRNADPRTILGEPNYREITCIEVVANMQSYTARQLPTKLERAMAAHLASCPQCQKKIQQMLMGEVDNAVRPVSRLARSNSARKSRVQPAFNVLVRCYVTSLGVQPVMSCHRRTKEWS